ncbi:UTP--glucose-1-phosphate uridylyltransferase 3, chloroplastic [Iris pallida]|uniref:UTP--glucose-1-phosphate uridylyltransferase 3, chloroplastic n=1 Tax=Iris pallida TaxID=29817 RepID=A0AAX6H7K1_IRIPA|nr:UTP--glucose-1-phosphate uridylyltransferase 3, chloroplastic [Iris pallida]
MATSTSSSSSSSLFSTPFVPPRSLSPSSSPRFVLRFRQLPLRVGTPPISSSFSTSSTSSEFKKQKLSTSHTELHQSPPELDFRGEVSRLRSLLSRIQQVDSLEEKVSVLDSDSRVRGLLKGRVSRILSSLELPEAFLLKCMVAAGQGHVLGDNEKVIVESTGSGSALKKAFCILGDMVEKWSLNGNGGGDHGGLGGLGIGGKEELRNLLKTLGQMEKFYDCIGGIIGYQILVLEHLSPLEAEANWSHLHESVEQFLKLHVPHGHNLVENTEYASQAAMWGIEGLPELGEIYPLGGAGDRLGLVDSKTGDCLPAAMLPYCGRTLLEGLIRDLQAREYLHFKLYGKQSITPVAIMTSSVKNNHKHVTALCERLSWFGRGQQNFRLFEQPLVPVVAAEDGQWLITRPLSPLCKPGGHGAIWKLAYDKGIFQWFNSLGRKGATVRQVSNVVAATDLTLLALAGIGLHNQKKLGFASCQRNLGATEGINVLVEKQKLDGQWAYGLTCIEYTEFDKFGIRDAPIGLGSLQAEFPANTNVLYVDLRSAEKAGSSQDATCLPGIVLNLKKTISYVDYLGIQHSVYGGRLECTMQNIADNFLNTFTSRCNKDIESELDTFIVFNERKRVTSSAKRKRKPTDKSLHQAYP